MLFPSIVLAGAALALAVLGLAGPLHRAGLSLDTAYTIVTWAAHGGGVVALAAIVVAVLAYRARAWLRLAAAGVAVVAGLTCFAIGFLEYRRARNAPAIHDITTDLENPPTFSAVVARRADAPNRLDRPPQLAELQRQGYGELAPITLQTKPDQAFDRALAVAQSQAWEIVTADKSSGRIEATHTTWWFGFVDDVVVRLTPWGSGTRIDVRSVSRSGVGDAGRNADRIRRFLRELQR
jgi:uncharacterized protein (DUF1499 family)